MKKALVAEFFGTFLLVLFGTGSMIINDVTGGALTHLGIAIAWGGIVTIIITTLGRTSGAHVNPVVTLVFILLKELSVKKGLSYMIVQLGGALLASACWFALYPSLDNYGDTLPHAGVMPTLVIEIILTFILVLSILLLVYGGELQKKYLPVIIGGVVGIEAFVAGPLTNASMNPARSISPAIFSGQIDTVWIYLVATPIGAVLALGVYKLLKG